MTTQEILEAARSAKSALALADNTARNAALLGMADALCDAQNQSAILAANAEDMAAAKGHISDVMLDRLALTVPRIEAMAQGIREVAALPDPVGRVLNRVERPNGLVIEKTAVPMGVIAIIYESRPNVTSDAAALALKAGSACVLRGGKEAHRSAAAIVEALKEGLQRAGLPADALQLVEDTTRASANELMTATGYVDLLIPRGGAGLIRACVDNATVPVIETGTGICHVYVDGQADQAMALDILENAKVIEMQQTPRQLRPFIQVIDSFDNNEKLGIGFEARVGGGKLLVLAVDTKKKMDQRPATRQLLESIDRYVRSDRFAPEVTLDESFITSFMR